MKKTLIKMPDNKWAKLKEYLNVGTEYEILGSFGNGYIIKPEGCPDRLLLLKSSFTS